MFKESSRKRVTNSAESTPEIQRRRKGRRLLRFLNFSVLKLLFKNQVLCPSKQFLRHQRLCAGGMLFQYNTLVVHVIRVKDLKTKNGKGLGAYCSLNLVGHSKLRAKVETNANRLENGVCDWDEHVEFSINEAFTELQLNVKCRTKLGISDTLATKSLRLAEMQKSQSIKWFDLYKKGKEGVLKGQLLMSYEFSNQYSSSVSQFSLNMIEKESKMDKLKRHIPFSNKKKAQLDRASLASYAMSRRSSVCSNTSAIAFSPVPSPNVQSESEFRVHSNPGLHSPLKEEPLQNGDPARSSLQNNTTLNTARCDSISQCSVNMAEENSNLDKVKKNFTAKIRQKADKLLNGGPNRQSMLSIDEALLDMPTSKLHSRAQSIASSSGFASNGGGGILDGLNDNTSNEHLLNVIKQLRKELELKENRIRDLEDYTGKLLSRIMDVNPDLLHIQ
ncbi:unnamed protein product [Bursaphelenchus okinawaensis]|uniref:FIP-RBD domain-containing protein n=1 Tax=Bursaphelenchus okinawaensis TaxID=465554 RepID=A0A811K0Z7_9BILA|nr:unnamed protein product [Bursaphelenchus okinawaensis]CAG9088228.1 unnamed protein product [Bursaphelenchus okinawaensis]